MTEILVNSAGCDWYSAIKLTNGCWLAMLKTKSPDAVVVRDSWDPEDLQELLAQHSGTRH
jgi:hypothetical protein